jgi:sugar lactone lactonase YvrE
MKICLLPRIGFFAAVACILALPGCAKPRGSSPKPPSTTTQAACPAPAPIDKSLPATHREVPFIRPSPERVIEPSGAAADNAGRLYAFDATRGLIKQFSPDGHCLRTFRGTTPDPGRKRYWHQSLVWAGNSLFLLDTAAGQVRRFNEDGKLLGSVSVARSRPLDYLDDSLPFCADAAGNIYLAPRTFPDHNPILQKFSPQGKLLWERTLPGELQHGYITALALDRSGQLQGWLQESITSAQTKLRFLLTDDSGALIRPPYSSPDDNLDLMVGAAFDAQNNRYELWFETAVGGETYVVKYDPAGKELWDCSWPQTEGTGLGLTPQGEVFLTFRDYSITAPVAISVSADGKRQRVIGENGTAPGELRDPSGLAFDAEGKVYAGDYYNYRIQLFSPRGQYLKKSIGPVPGADSPMTIHVKGSIIPNSIFLDRRGLIYVTKVLGDVMLCCYFPDGKPVKDFPDISLGFGDDFYPPNRFAPVTYYPAAGAVDAKGNIWTAKVQPRECIEYSRTGESVYRNHGIKFFKFNESGKLLLTFEKYGKAPGEFGQTEERGIGFSLLAVDRQNNIWVVDPANHRVQKFDSQAKFLTQIHPKSGPAVLHQPWGVALDRKGNVYLADNTRILEFSPQGEFLHIAAYLADVPFPSDSREARPYRGFVIDAYDNIYITDATVDAVRKFVPNK